MSEAMSLKNAEQNNLLLILRLFLVPTSAQRVRKIFNLYIQRWRPFTLIFVSCRFCSPRPNYLVYIYLFVADSKALHLERSHTKVILKGLSMYIHYQRDWYWVKHDRSAQSKKLFHYYFKKVPQFCYDPLHARDPLCFIRLTLWTFIIHILMAQYINQQPFAMAPSIVMPVVDPTSTK